MPRLMALALLGLWLLFPTTGALAQGFRIGAVLPLTGVFGKDGSLVRDAYQFWADRVNGQGGLACGQARCPVELIFYDDQSNPQTSAKLVEKLITKDEVDLVLGGYGSSQVMAQSAVAERRHYPLVSGGASSDTLFARGYRYYFSTLGRATDEVAGAVAVLGAVEPKPKTVAIVGSNIPFTSQACEGFRRHAEALGLKVVHYELFPLALEDYNTMLSKVQAVNPDVLLVGSHLTVALRTVQAMKQIGFAPKAVAFSYGPTVPAFAETLGADTEYLIAASEWTPNLPYEGPVFGKASDFARDYQARFNRQPDYVEAASAAGAVALQTAVEQLGLKPPLKEADRVALMEKLHQLDLMTFYGHLKFGEHGANVAHPPVAVQYQKGQLLSVHPPEWAQAKPIYPMPAWSAR